MLDLKKYKINLEKQIDLSEMKSISAICFIFLQSYLMLNPVQQYIQSQPNTFTDQPTVKLNPA